MRSFMVPVSRSMLDFGRGASGFFSGGEDLRSAGGSAAGGAGCCAQTGPAKPQATKTAIPNKRGRDLRILIGLMSPNTKLVPATEARTWRTTFRRQRARLSGG